MTNSKIGKATQAPRRVLPHTLKSVVQCRQDIQSWQRALYMMQNIEQPMSYPLQLLYNNVLQDALLSSQIDNRKAMTFSSDFSIIGPDGEVDEEATGKLKKTAGLRAIFDEILDATYRGYSLFELTVLSPDKFSITSLPRTNVLPREGKFLRDYMDQASNATDYRQLSEYGLYIFEVDQTNYDTQEFGLLNKLVPHALMKRFATSCWSELCEIYGIPPRVLKTNTTDNGMLARGEQMMRDMGAAAYFIIDEEEELSFANGASTNGDVYKNLINLCNNEISLLISGAIYGQDTVNGNRSKDESAQNILWEKVLADQRRIEQVFNEHIMPALVIHGFIQEGSTLAFNEAEDTDKLFKYTQPFLTSMNYKVDIDWIQEKFGIKVEHVTFASEQDMDKEPDTKDKKLSAELPSNFFD